MRRVLPVGVPLRHWVLTLPLRNRVTLRPGGRQVAKLAKAFVEGVFGVYRSYLPAAPKAETHCGAAVVVHGLGSSLDRNLHVHVVALDGAYRICEHETVFQPHGSRPTSRDLRRVLRGVSAMLPEASAESAVTTQTHSEIGPVRRLHVMNVGSSEASGARASPPRARIAPSDRTGASKAVVNGIAVYAGAIVEPTDRAQISRLAAYVVRPEVDPRAFERGPTGQVRYRLRRQGPDGATHVEMTPAAAIARLSSCTEHGKSGRVSYHGILAPAAADRWRVVETQLRLAPDLVDPKRGDRQRPAPRRSKSNRRPPTRDWGGACPVCGASLTLVSVEDSGPL